MKISTSGDAENAQKCTPFFSFRSAGMCKSSRYYGIPVVFCRLNSTDEVAEKLIEVPIRQISTLDVNISTLKKAFTNQEVREALALKSPSNSEPLCLTTFDY
jgi:hypothetical protein